MYEYPCLCGTKIKIDKDIHDSLSLLMISVKLDHRGYAKISNTKYKKGTAFLHRVILKAHKDYFVDHIDGDPLNNTRANLRLVNASQNTANSNYTRSKLYPRGVSYMKGSTSEWKYYTRVSVKGKRIFKGYYKTIEDAKFAHKKLSLEVNGQYSFYYRSLNEEEKARIAITPYPKTKERTN